MSRYTEHGVDNTKDTKHRLQHAATSRRSEDEDESEPEAEDMSEDEPPRRTSARSTRTVATRGVKKSYK